MIKITEAEAREIVQLTKENGGFTYTGNLTKEQRYSVGLGIHETVLEELTAQDILNYVEIVNQYGVVFGTWFNQDNKKYYLDLVEIHENKELALQVAKLRDEIAIYDLKENEEIKVK